MKSILFVPADNERKLAKAVSCGADALAFDLEDSVLPERKPLARLLLVEYLKTYSGASEVWIRVNDLASGELLRDLAAVVASKPVGIVLPKVFGPEDITTVSHYLDMAETQAGLPLGGIAILAVITETPAAVLRMGEFTRHSFPRLKALMWGGEDLSSAMGAGDPRQADGRWRPVYEHARIQCLLAAHALGVEALDTVYVDFRNSDGCRANSEGARYDGFTGKCAIHPDQVPVINAAFSPSEEEIAFAHRVIAAFETGAGAVQLDGKMLDVPHLKAARRLLAAAGV
ncbi:CoA ester lyase [uncultured Nevskia sp.]|uniref:HpcH/HpaI aldolase/citrate lyase family protein n=1 Tax=uncultured Nevskia sp. TaxID=228950 RepID=UPI0025D5EA5E|nr:CoA ester lyase [uncultured Nevskia sp.]